MPQRSKSVQEATVGQWLVGEGDPVKTGDTIAHAEAADALYELQAAGDGVLLKIIATEGTVVATGAPIALLGAKGDDVDEALAELEAAQAPAAQAPKAAVALPRTDTSAPAPVAAAGQAGGAVAAAPAAGGSFAAEAPAGITPLIMPKPGQSVEEGTILTWRVKEGDTIAVGDIVYDLETDKATVEVESDEAGRISRIVVQEDQIADVLTPVAYLSDDDAAVDAFLAGGAPATAVASAPAQGAAGGVAPASATAPAEVPVGITPLIMPKPGQSVEEGTILTWRVKEGDTIAVGDIVYDLETDKATVEVESDETGRISRIIVQEDQIADVLTPVAYLSDDDAAVDAFLAGAASAPAAGGAVAQSGAAGAAGAAVAPANVTAPATTTATGRVKASPAARKLAAERGTDLAAIGAGSGPGGRILSTDVAAAKPGAKVPKSAKAVAPSEARAEGPSPVGDPVVMGEPKRVKMSGMRKAIARNLQYSKQTIPHFYIKQEIRAEALMATYKKLKDAAEFKCTINDFVVAACAKVINETPQFRCRIDGTEMLEYPNANVGIAVGVENGLVVPVVKQADTLNFRDLATETRRIVEAARGGKPENMGQGVFTITNMGMFKIGEFLAIVNPPEAAILAVGAAREVPVVEDGKVVPAMVMNVILSVDHRIIDGVLAAEFVNRLKELLEAPQQLI